MKVLIGTPYFPKGTWTCILIWSLLWVNYKFESFKNFQVFQHCKSLVVCTVLFLFYSLLTSEFYSGLIFAFLNTANSKSTLDKVLGFTSFAKSHKLIKYIKWLKCYCKKHCSVQFSHSVVSHSLQPHESQHTRPRCPSPAPRIHPNPYASSQWCHPTLSCSLIPFSCFQSFPASGSFPMSQLFTWGGQSIGVSASTSVLSMNTQDWSPLGWVSLQSKGLSRVFSNTTVEEHQFFCTQLSL